MYSTYCIYWFGNTAHRYSLYRSYSIWTYSILSWDTAFRTQHTIHLLYNNNIHLDLQLTFHYGLLYYLWTYWIWGHSMSQGYRSNYRTQHGTTPFGLTAHIMYDTIYLFTYGKRHLSFVHHMISLLHHLGTQPLGYCCWPIPFYVKWVQHTAHISLGRKTICNWR